MKRLLLIGNLMISFIINSGVQSAIGDDALVSLTVRKIFAAAPQLFEGIKTAPDETMKGWYHTDIVIPGTEKAGIDIFDSTHAFYNTYIIRDAGKNDAIKAWELWKKKLTVIFPEMKMKTAGNKYIFEPASAGPDPQPGIVISSSAQSGASERWNTMLFINYGIK